MAFRYAMIIGLVSLFAVGATAQAAGWTEDFESYTATHSATVISPAWDNLTPAEEWYIVATDIGGNTSKKLTGMYYGDPWAKRSIGGKANGDIVLTAQLSLGAVTHTSHPLANHVMLGNVALGIAGKQMSYRVYSLGSFPKAITTIDEFTKVGTDIPAATWYDVKIVVHQVAGLLNDTADLMYKAASDSSWTDIASNVPLLADFDGFVYVVTRYVDAGVGYVDNISVSYEPAESTLLNLVNEKFEGYAVGHSINYLSPAWENIGTDPLNRTPAPIEPYITDVNIGGNVSKKITSIVSNYPWLRKSFAKPVSGDVIMMAKMALAANTHTSHPLACHIMLGNVAFGIAGDKLSYKVFTPGTYPMNIADASFFTKLGSSIPGATWYDVKIVVHQNAGASNDTADLYYKTSGNSSWINAVSGLALNADLDGYACMITRAYQGTSLNAGYIDDVQIAFEASQTSATEMWSDNLETYAINSSFWDTLANVPWDNISNPVKYGRIFKYDPAVSTVNWKIQNNTSAILFGLGSNLVWYSRDIGTVTATDTVVFEGQVANYAHTATTGHVSWPLGDHLVVGGVALGIGGDDITYQVLNSVPPATVIDQSTVTRVAPAQFKTWYDVRIVYKQIAGANNDKADLYYKLSTDEVWTIAATNLQLTQDLGSKLYLYIYGDTTYLGAMDNLLLKKAVPVAQICGEAGTNYVPADFNKDCYVDFQDFAEMAKDWMKCYDPNPSKCF